MHLLLLVVKDYFAYASRVISIVMILVIGYLVTSSLSDMQHQVDDVYSLAEENEDMMK